MRKPILVMLAVLLGVSFIWSPNDGWAQSARDKDFIVKFTSLPLRGFFYPPAKVGENFVRVRVESNLSTMEFHFESLPPNTLLSLWFANIFVVNRAAPFVGTEPISPAANPFLPFNAGTIGAGFDANGDGDMICGEGIDGFDPVTGQAQGVFDPHMFCSDMNGHANPVIRVPFDVTNFAIPAEIPALLQTEVVTMLNGQTQKRRHVIDSAHMRRFEDEDPERRGFQKLDALGRPKTRNFRTAPYVVCAHFDGLIGTSHGHNPGNLPEGGPSSTVVGTNFECLMVALVSSQARTSDEQ